MGCLHILIFEKLSINEDIKALLMNESLYANSIIFFSQKKNWKIFLEEKRKLEKCFRISRFHLKLIAKKFCKSERSCKLHNNNDKFETIYQYSKHASLSIDIIMSNNNTIWINNNIICRYYYIKYKDTDMRVSNSYWLFSIHRININCLYVFIKYVIIILHII